MGSPADQTFLTRGGGQLPQSTPRHRFGCSFRVIHYDIPMVPGGIA